VENKQETIESTCNHSLTGMSHSLSTVTVYYSFALV